MTEAEWLTSEDPGSLLDATQDGDPAGNDFSERKYRLFSCACCRRIWRLLTLAKSRELVECAERYADDAELSDSLEAIRQQHLEEQELLSHSERAVRADWAASAATLFAGWSDVRENHGNQQGAGYVPYHIREAVLCEAGASTWDGDAKFELQEREDRAMCDLLRDIFGNPFRPVAFAPEWRTGTATAIARQMYESRDFGAMPILADALQDAGCDADDILNHCRDTAQVHVRGCWVVDLVLGLS